MLELQNVSFAVDGEEGTKEIVKNVSLKIEDGFVALKRRFENNDDEETLQRFEEFRIGTYDHPTEEDLENARAFVVQALEPW